MWDIKVVSEEVHGQLFDDPHPESMIRMPVSIENVTDRLDTFPVQLAGLLVYRRVH